MSTISDFKTFHSFVCLFIFLTALFISFSDVEIYNQLHRYSDFPEKRKLFLTGILLFCLWHG